MMTDLHRRLDVLCRRPNCFRIYFQCDNYGETYFRCYLEANVFQRTSAIAGSMEEALNKAEELLDRVKHLNVKKPRSEDQPYNGGYYRYMLGENEIEFRRFNDMFFVTRIGPPREAEPIDCFV